MTFDSTSYFPDVEDYFSILEVTVTINIVRIKMHNYSPL